MVERDHKGNDKDSLFEHKHRKIRQRPSHISKVVATNNLKALAPWSCYIQNIMLSLETLKLHMAIKNIQKTITIK
jgi:hypothetical protein